MKSILFTLLLLLSAICFAQVTDETFRVKKKTEKTTTLQALRSESFKQAKDSVKLTWWQTQLDGDDTVSKATLRLGYSMSINDQGYSCRILSFTMDFIEGDNIKKLSCNRPYLSQPMAMQLSGLKPGSTIIIRDVTFERYKQNYTQSSPESAMIFAEPGPVTEIKRTGPFRIYVPE